MNSAFSLWKKPVDEHPQNLRKQDVNGEKRMVATKVLQNLTFEVQCWTLGCSDGRPQICTHTDTD